MENVYRVYHFDSHFGSFYVLCTEIYICLQRQKERSEEQSKAIPDVLE